MDLETGTGKVLPVYIEEEMQKSYIDYAMSVIVQRALPDVRDGLKPVHRRILYAMQEAGMASNKPYKKSARIVGEVLGKYHPHGDTSVYDAIVRLAQNFSTRYLMVDGHGNFGSVDGDSAAAMRYTEARLNKLGEAMMDDLYKETVDFEPNFDNTLVEPKVMPTRIPNLLVNGASGIAVGMATNMPPHNLSEVIDACDAYIDNPEITVEELMEFVKAPDFPTGGYIYGVSGVREAYLTGRGRVVMRARAEIESGQAHDKIVQADGSLFFGGNIFETAPMLEEMGADAVGINCSTGPDQLENIIQNLAGSLSVPVIAKPNAGMPTINDQGIAVYDMTPEYFGKSMKRLVDLGASMVGGCCGTDPSYIKALVNAIR